MKKRVICGVLLLFWLCGCASASDQTWANVADYGAVGNAVYQYSLGEQSDEWSFRVGYYSELALRTYYAPCWGEVLPEGALTVIADSQPEGENQVHLSEARANQKFYEPQVGDVVLACTAADEDASVLATDDSDAFERAIAESGGKLYLPSGDYVVSQLTAAKITDIRGPGKIWLKEWGGGTAYYLAGGIGHELICQNLGWIDERHFLDSGWRDMHWVTCLPEVYGWTDSKDFTGKLSPRREFGFYPTRDNINTWVTVEPAVPEEDFPDSVTICISNMSSNYTLKGGKKWRRGSEGGIGGGMFSVAWDGRGDYVSDYAWKDQGAWVEITLKKKDFFRTSDSGETENWALHCWTEVNKSLKGQPVEYVCNTARVWVKGAAAEGCLMCDIGGDMRTTWDDRDLPEGNILEACNSGTQLLSQTPRRFYSYTVPDEQYDRYQPFPT